jgi:hypothetical protein
MATSDDHTEVLRSAWYETLRPYLPQSKRELLETPNTTFVSGDSGMGRGIRGLFTSEVDRIEREWNLRP